jgi:hypothetical protein
LDGANRVAAFKRLGIPHIVAQVVEADEPGLDLSSWHHVIWGVSSDDLMAWFQKVPDLQLKPTNCEEALQDVVDIHCLGVFCSPNEQAYTLLTSKLRLVQRIKVLNAMVGCYLDQASIDRTRLMDITSLRELYPKLAGLVVFSTFRIDQILHIVGEGHLMPPGTTRFMISPRILYLNYPLEELASQKSLQTKNTNLQQLVQDRLAGKGVRFYAESTIFFDE